MKRVFSLGLQSKKAIFAVWFIFIMSGIFASLRTWYSEPVIDELGYKFFVTNEFELTEVPDSIAIAQDNNCLKYHSEETVNYRRICDFKDIIECQMNQWYQINGRFILHVLAQSFINIWGHKWFSIFNGIIITLILLMLFSYRGLSKGYGLSRSIIIAVILSVGLYYLYVPCRYFEPMEMAQEIIFVNVAFSVNYLWPIPLILGFLSLFRSQLLCPSCRFNKFGKTLGLMLSLISGATQEVFVLPICILTAIVLLIRIIQKKNISIYLMAICVCFWVGAASVGLSPGNITRATTGEYIEHESLYTSILKLVLTHWVVIFAAFTAIALCVCRRMGYISSVRPYSYEITMVIVSSLFAVVAHTTIASYNGVRFYSCLLLLVVLQRYLVSIQSQIRLRFLFALSTCLLALYFYHQSIIAVESRQTSLRNYGYVEKFIESPDGIIVSNPVEINPIAADFVFDFGTSTWSWHNKALSMAYGNNKKIPFFLSKYDFEVLSGKKEPRVCDYLSGDTRLYRLQHPANPYFLLKREPGVSEKSEIKLECGPILNYETNFLAKLLIKAKKSLQKCKGKESEESRNITENIRLDNKRVIKVGINEYFVIPYFWASGRLPLSAN